MPPVSDGKNSNWETGRQELAVLATVQSGMYIYLFTYSLIYVQID